MTLIFGEYRQSLHLAESDDDRPQHHRRKALGGPEWRNGHHKSCNGRQVSPQIHPLFVLLA